MLLPPSSADWSRWTPLSQPGHPPRQLTAQRPPSRSGSAARAVIVLGYSTVRESPRPLPRAFSPRTSTSGPRTTGTLGVVAAGAAVAAGVLGVGENEAFSAGLLHDIGSALLHGADPDGYELMLADHEPGALDEAEQAAFGTTHAEAGAAALELWQFPHSFVVAVRTHHEPVRRVGPLGQAVVSVRRSRSSSSRSAPPRPAWD